jgi:Ca2+-binding EF-hand superfamily protein
MKQLLCALFVVAMGLGMVGMAQAADEKPKKPFDPEAAFKKMDTNSDGKLTLDEFKGKKKDEALANAEKIFKAKDKDNDGFLTLEEFKAPVKKDGAKKDGVKKEKKEKKQ